MIFFHHLFISALVILGIWTVFRKEMLFGEVGEWCNKHMPQWLYKPLIGCPPCMSSIHGTWLWFFLGGDVLHWPIFCLALCGLLKLIVIEWLNRP